VHRNQPDPALGRMAAQIWHAATNRLPAVAVDEPARTEAVLRSWHREGDGFAPDDASVDLTEREPMDRFDRPADVPSTDRRTMAP